MKILHLTDLHVTPPNPSLKSVWIGARNHLGDHPFDFVIASGDLTQRADKDEFTRVGEFLQDQVLPLVKGSERRRIILVPGNHDVAWGAKIGAPIDVAEIDKDPARKKKFDEEFEAHLKDPGGSTIRASFGPRGVERLLRIRDEDYPSRFAPFQKFLRDFYGNEFPKSRADRLFHLDSADETQHFSAHVFADAGDEVAFYGLSSCHGNDRDWRGAALSPRALEHVEQHLAEHAKGLQRVAVWHHGLTSERGYPDHLTLQEIAHLAQLRFDLGIHGHTHEEELRDLGDQLQYGLPIIATGSFAAGPPERPGGVANQISIISLNRAGIRWRLFERDHKNQWTRHPRPDVVYLTKPQGRRLPAEFERSEIHTHRREVVLDRHGIADVDVVLEHVTLDGDLTLGRPRPCLNNIAFNIDPQERASTGKGSLSLPVTLKPRADGERQFVLRGDGRPRYDEIRWRYVVANGFALSQADLALRDKDEKRLEVPEGYDALAYICRAHTDQLVLEVKLPDPDAEAGFPGAFADETMVRAEYRNPALDPPWLEDPAEAAHIDHVPITPGSRTNRISMTVRSPIPDYRYVLGFRLADAGHPIPDDVSLLLRRVVSACRDSRTPVGGLSARLTDAVGAGIRKALDASDDKLPSLWVGHLWCHETLRLLASFGSFPARSWGTRFPYGAGIVGHGFRMGQSTFYFRNARLLADPAGRRKALLYREVEGDDGPGQRQHEWIVSVPILIAKEGMPAVGMVGFTDRCGDCDGAPRADGKLRALAQSMAHLHTPDAEAEKTIMDLTLAVSHVFWYTLSNAADDILEGSLRIARGVFEQHWQRKPPPDPAPPA